MEEVKRFCKQTSMKGVPRILKSESPCLRILWLLAVLGFLTISLLQVYTLLVQYYKREKITKISETSMMSFVLPQPELNICNLNTLTRDISRYEGFPTLHEYYELVDELTTCENCSGEEKDYYMYAKRGLMTSSGYYSFIGPRNASKVGHNVNEFIVSCSIIFADGVSEKRTPCEDMVRIIPLQTNEYFNCFNIGFNSSNIENFTHVIGISLVLFLDKMEELSFEGGVDGIWEYVEGTGVQLNMHGSEIIPTLLTEQHILAPGKNFDIRFTPHTRKRLEPPHGECNPKAGERFMYIGQLGITRNFSSQACLVTCLEKAVFRDCGCISAQDIDLSHYLNLPSEYCGDLKKGLEKASSTLKCAENTRERTLEKCLKQCPKDCTEHIYRTETTDSTWPKKSHVKAFYKHYIQGTIQEAKFSKLGSLIEQNGSKPYDNSSEKVILEEAFDFIRDNYVKCSIFNKDFTHIVIEDTIKTTPFAYLSQLGGTLNLWSGISAIVAIEISEMIYRIFAYCCCTEDNVKKEIGEKSCDEKIKDERL